uniref:Uncharacterized protein n=1 Tax=Acanthochromis polyacanthus TaxID=80966 RepID=A0A3Q1FTW2_9TELE
RTSGATGSNQIMEKLTYNHSGDIIERLCACERMALMQIHCFSSLSLLGTTTVHACNAVINT